MREGTNFVDRKYLFGFGLALLLCFNGAQSVRSAQSQAAEPVESDKNKVLVRRWIEEGFNGRDLRVVDEIFAETFELNGNVISRENLKQSMRRRLTAFPDLRVTIEEIIGEGDKVGIWYTVQGTHRGEFEGIGPTGSQVNWFGFDLLRIESGKITQGRFIDDALGLMRQLGATLSPPANKK